MSGAVLYAVCRTHGCARVAILAIYGIGLTVAGLAWLAWTLWNRRGRA